MSNLCFPNKYGCDSIKWDMDDLSGTIFLMKIHFLSWKVTVVMSSSTRHPLHVHLPPPFSHFVCFWLSSSDAYWHNHYASALLCWQNWFLLLTYYLWILSFCIPSLIVFVETLENCLWYRVPMWSWILYRLLMSPPWMVVDINVNSNLCKKIVSLMNDDRSTNLWTQKIRSHWRLCPFIRIAAYFHLGFNHTLLTQVNCQVFVSLFRMVHKVADYACGIHTIITTVYIFWEFIHYGSWHGLELAKIEDYPFHLRSMHSTSLNKEH